LIERDDCGLQGKAAGLRVVLVGWLGAQPKYLHKYTELWESQGATVVPYIPPMTAALFPAQADRSVRLSLESRVEKRGLWGLSSMDLGHNTTLDTPQ
jgi:hypothetical protein